MNPALSKILFVSTMESIPWGGSELLWTESAAILANQGFKIGSTVRKWPHLSPPIADLASRGSFSTVCSASSRRAFFKYTGTPIIELLHIKYHNPTHVVISQGFNNDGMAWMHACSSLKIPYVVIVQAASSTGWQKDLIAFKLADLYQKADKVFFVSRNNQKLTEEQIGTNLSNAEIIWNPCGIKRVQEIAWPITPNIAVVGRLDPDAKGCDLVLHAVNQVEWGDTKPTITFYGEGSCRQLLTRLRDKLNIPNVQFAGARTLPDIWSNNQLLLLPSRYEGLPLAVIEAMLCGRPCLVTRFSGGDEVLTHEKTGFICEAPTSPLLQDTLQKAWDLRAEWPKMGQAALQHIRQIYPTDPANTFVERIKAAFIKT